MTQRTDRSDKTITRESEVIVQGLKLFASDAAMATSFRRSAGVKSAPASGALLPLRDTSITPKTPDGPSTGAVIIFWITLANFSSASTW